MSIEKSRLRKYAAELAELGFNDNLIDEMVKTVASDLPQPSPSLYKGLELYYSLLRENFLLGLVRACVGKKFGKRFKNADHASCHIRVCLQCQAEIINFTTRIKQEFDLT